MMRVSSSSHRPQLDSRHRWPNWGLFGLIAGMLTACQSLPGSPILETELDDPHVAFTNAATVVEPLINPELDALQATQLSGAGASSSAAQTGIQLPKVSPLELGDERDGEIAIATSPELLPLNEQLYQRFIQEGYSGVLDINTMTANRAVKQFCQQSDTVFLTLSRPLTSAEQDTCKTQSRQPTDFAIGKDALLLVVHPQAQFVRGVTLAKLPDILTRATWSDVDKAWPQESIQRRLIGPDSATVIQIAQNLFDGDSSPLLNAANTVLYRDVEPMMQDLSQTPQGVGLLSYSLNQRAPRLLRAVPINGITASLETIESGAYPLRRMMYLYVDKSQLQSQEFIAAWVNFYLTHVHEAIAEANLFPLNPTELNRSKQKWLTLTRKD